MLPGGRNEGEDDDNNGPPDPLINTHRLADLTRVRDVLTRVAPFYVEKMRMIDEHLIPNGYSSDTLAGSVSGGDISDPTANNATNEWRRRRGWINSRAHLVVKLIDGLDKELRMLPQVGPLDDKGDDPRCSGGSNMKGSADWGRPECERNAVTRDGLCSACYQRRHDHMSKQDAA